MSHARAAAENLLRRVALTKRVAINRVYRLTDAYGLTSPESVYSEDYYAKRTDEVFTRDAADLSAAVYDAFEPESVIDLGCAVGHYLQPLSERGVDVLGVDAHPAAVEHTVIPEDRMVLADLREPYDPPQRFDLALCIEVAEHLAPRYADTLVDTTARCAPTVVFTAAPPGQGGDHHVNEQPRSYWSRKFRARGYAPDEEALKEIRAAVEPVKLHHVPRNLFVFREGEA